MVTRFSKNTSCTQYPKTPRFLHIHAAFEPPDLIPVYSFLVLFFKTTNEHAVKAFDIHAIDYVLKPYQDERLLEALNRVPVGSHLASQTVHNLGLIAQGKAQVKNYLKRISVKDRFEFKIIDVEAIDFFATEDSLVFLHSEGLHYIVDKSLTQLEQSLDPDMFFRSHRKSIVNLNRIERVVPWGRGRYVLKFSHDEKVHLSKDKTREFKLLMGLH
jgi:DNA-binding LytR/AlgR family response regulator